MIIYENKRKFWYPYISMGSWKTWTTHSNPFMNGDRNGHYYGTIHVRIQEMDRQDKNVTILEASYNGNCFQRNYDHTGYSERGLMLLCARFIKDIMKGKIK